MALKPPKLAYDVARMERARMARGLSHAELARAIKKPRTSLYEQLKSGRIRPYMAKALAEFFGIPLDDLVIEVGTRRDRQSEKQEAAA